MTAILVLQIPCPDRDTATRIALAPVQERRAACSHVLPGHESRRWWDGAVATADAWTVAHKTRLGLGGAAAARARAVHPDALPAVTGHRPAFVEAVHAPGRSAKRGRPDADARPTPCPPLPNGEDGPTSVLAMLLVSTAALMTASIATD